MRAEEEEDQDAVGRVEQDIGRVMAGRIQPIDLAVEHVARSMWRMPVANGPGGERPADILPTEPALHLGVLA